MIMSSQRGPTNTTRNMRRKVLKPRTRSLPAKAPPTTTRTTRSTTGTAAVDAPEAPQPVLDDTTDTPKTKRRRRRAGADPWLPRRKPKSANPRPRAPPPTHFTCRICADEQPVENFIKWLPRSHYRGYVLRHEIPFTCVAHLARNPRRKQIDPVCKTCIGQSMAAQMETLGARKVGQGCLEPECYARWDLTFIMKYFPLDKLETYNEGMMKVWLDDAKTMKCVKEGCDGMGLVDPFAAGYPQVSCPSCRTRMCVSCNIPWHAGITCADYAARHVHQKMSDPEKETLKIMQEKDGKRCPNCFIVIEKDGGCDSMYCFGCKTYFNWAMAASAVPGKGQAAVMQPTHFGGMIPMSVRHTREQEAKKEEAPAGTTAEEEAKSNEHPPASAYIASERSSTRVRFTHASGTTESSSPWKKRLRQVLLDPLLPDKVEPESAPSLPTGAKNYSRRKAENMQTDIQFVTTPTADTPGTTLVVHTVNGSYIFGNVAEGTQRAINQMGSRLIKTQNFFITGRNEWRNTGGMIGMILTLADVTATSYESVLDTWLKKRGKLPRPERPSLHIHGPSNLKHMVATCRRFIFRKGMPVKVTEHKQEPPRRSNEEAIAPSWQDGIIRVWALALSPKSGTEGREAANILELEQQKYEAEVNNFEDHKAPESENAEDRESRYDRIRTQVIEHMFNSDWKFDTLVEKHISDVEMPATMYIRNPETHQLENYTGPLPGGETALPDIKVLTRTPWPGALVQGLPPTKRSAQAVSYIVKTFAMRGKLDIDRARELKVKRGPDLGRLAKGESVQSETGETITPDMVLGPDRPAQAAAILDVPSIDYLESLLDQEELSSPQLLEGIRLFVWILGPGVSGHPILVDFMRKLDTVQHVVSSPDHSPNRLTFDSVAGQTVRLRQIDPKRYEVPYYNNNTLPQVDFGSASYTRTVLPPNAIAAERGLNIRIMPNFDVQKDRVPELLDVSAIAGDTSSDYFDLAIAAQKAEAQSENDADIQAWKQQIPRPDTDITTLGTGSALPSKYRNVSATLVRVPGVGNYLFDAGENTLGQLQRAFTPDELRTILQDLRMIWISHLHADHHLGTTSVIKAWYAVKHNSVPNKKAIHMPSISTNAEEFGLSVVSNEGMLKWLHEYSAIEDFGYSRILPLHVSPANQKSGSSPGQTALSQCVQNVPVDVSLHALRRKDYESVLGLSDIQAWFVAHCRAAMAVSITFPVAEMDAGKKPLKISYSGDCRPSYKYADNIGRDSTVLIHEATFDDELVGDAKAKKHSTTSEALSVGARMNAKAVVLTHFSQRYQRIPVLQPVEDEIEDEDVPDVEDVEHEPVAEDDVDPTTENMDITPNDKDPEPSASLKQHVNMKEVIKVHAKDMKVAIAFDYMRVKISDIIQLEKYNDALSKLLEVKDNEGNVKELKNGNGKKSSDGEAGGKNKKAKRNN
ncbi:hypothetical protein BDV96DRAFT_628485 [Lophiotrema nucula]|uniref:ribonuclease Z n=1 Tax=Lophiotrema nucula TaxID=690887 RepID=A0A6A5ZKJ2_9PLEO|nr:hypothetical protein BDV96DRAFT_628485 [Lophiotrema nucula]